MFFLYTENGARYGVAPSMEAVRAAGYRHGVAGTRHQDIVLVTFEDGQVVCHDHCENQDKILADVETWQKEREA